MDRPEFPWRRYTHGDIPIYISTASPNWFVPTHSGDRILTDGLPHKDPQIHKFLSRLPVPRHTDYSGRATALHLDRINELWFHLTNRCNMTCRHCLFASSPTDCAELSSARVTSIASEAHQCGCRLFALTGGEPLVHPDIDAILTHLLALDQAHVVMLTNGSLLVPMLERHRPDPDRLHLQISVDGLEHSHDTLRGSGAFMKLSRTCSWLRQHGVPYTLSMCVTHANVHEMADLIDFAHAVGARNVHYMWFFVRGRGTPAQFAPIEQIYDNMIRAARQAQACGMPIDNLEALKTQIFAPAGTIHDGSTAGWESLAVGPDGRLYPSAALVGIDALATDMSSGLRDAWQRSPVLQQIRHSSACSLDAPLRFILGGGDIDHSYHHRATFLGDDPYEPLYAQLALWLIAQEAARQPQRPEPGIRLQMGEILESCGAHGAVALVHSNCLLATAEENSLTTIKQFYSEAIADSKTDILNPVCYDQTVIAHIPEEFRFRGYGCGSPVLDADIRPGDHVVDLGCGSGVECFIAARLTGSAGRVTGIDMLDPMLTLARTGQPLVAANLGYDNLSFKKGYLEAVPLANDTVDVVISNCVMNLSVHKRAAYGEIFRMLRPGGRLVIADVTCDDEPDPAIRNDENLRGECIAGALTTAHLVALLEETGFTGVMLCKRFAYRTVQGHPFFSLTYTAVKPRPETPIPVIYRGPLPALMLPDGQLLRPGAPASLDRQQADLLGEQLFQLDTAGNVLNIEAENTCACAIAPEQAETATAPTGKKRTTGCMVCGAPLAYQRIAQKRRCAFCGMTVAATSVCTDGHYVCDQCHAHDAVAVIRQICRHTDECDMIRLLAHIRQHPAIPMHGPEYHALVPAIVLTTYRNRGGVATPELIEAGISRGSGIAGGFCGFMGICGAAVGVGIAFSLLLDANPVRATERTTIQRATQSVLHEIAQYCAARCCQRDVWIALTRAAELSQTILPIALQADCPLVCQQMAQNNECLGRQCPLHPHRQQ